VTEAADSITVMQARPGKRMAKTMLPDGRFIDYDSARYFNAETAPLAGLADLWPLLHWLLPRHDRCVVRGRLIAGDTARNIRRLLYKDKKTGDQPTLIDVARHWLMLDVDGIPRPPNVDAADLLACADVAMGFLPPAFRHATAIILASAGHGVKPGCRLRLCFWCSRPMQGDELKRWLKPYPVDRSVFGAAQPIYTAAPILAPGVTDHLPQRIAKWPGAGVLAVPTAEELQPPPRPIPQTVHPACRAGSARAALYCDAAVRNACNRIRTASQRHPAILKEARSLARFVAAGMLTETELHSALWSAAQQAGKDDENEIASMIAFAMQHPLTAALPLDVRNG